MPYLQYPQQAHLAGLVAEITRLGLTQVEIAARAGLTQPTVSRLMGARHADPRAPTVRAIERLHAEVTGAP